VKVKVKVKMDVNVNVNVNVAHRRLQRRAVVKGRCQESLQVLYLSGEES
jgi:hypothetical protein